MKNKYLSYIEISKESLIHNIKQFRSIVNPPNLPAGGGGGTKIAGVVKANAYGHGQNEVVKILNQYVDYFQVNSVGELGGVRKITKKPVLLLGYVGASEITKAIKLKCILTVFGIEHMKLINANAKKLNKIQKVHIAIDAHLGREGIMPADIEDFLLKAKNQKNIEIDGAYAHFANIEDTKFSISGTYDFTHAQKQIETYTKVIEVFKKFGYNKIATHISATSGVLAYEACKGRTFTEFFEMKRFDLYKIVRIGIGLYGMWPSIDLQKMWQTTSISPKVRGRTATMITLKPVLRWVTHIAEVKTLPKGHSIGYGLSYITKKSTRIAVIPQGYSDGFPRSLSNKGYVLIGGHKAPVLGRVAMNMFVVDVSHINDAKAGDEVVLLGRQGNPPAGGAITAEELGALSDTINYEVTTRISPLLPRVIA